MRRSTCAAPQGQPLAVEFYAIDINFGAITDPEERRYTRNLPTSFVLTEEQVDRLREMAGRLLRQSPDYQRLLRDLESAPSPGQRVSTGARSSRSNGPSERLAMGQSA